MTKILQENAEGLKRIEHNIVKRFGKVVIIYPGMTERG